MKKVFGLMLGMLLVVSLAGCGGKKNDMQPSAEKTAGVSSTKGVSKSTADDKTLSANISASAGNTSLENGSQSTGNASSVAGNTSNTSGDAGAGGALSKVDYSDRGNFFVSYPSDIYTYDPDYTKLKRKDGEGGIMMDALLGDTNYEEFRNKFETEFSGNKNYSLEETDINGYKTMVVKYDDSDGGNMVVIVDFNGFFGEGSYYGMRFVVSGKTIADCDTDVVWSIIKSFELVK